LATIQCGDVQFQNIQGVVFDKDGTLADSLDFLRNLAQKRARLIDAQIPGVGDPLMMAFGLNENHLNPAGLMMVGTRHENEIAAAAYVAETGKDWLEALTIVRLAFVEADKVFQRKADGTPMFDGIRELLQALVATEIRIGILSSDTTDNVRDFVRRYQLEPLVELAIGTEEGPTKPDPALLRWASEALGVPVEKVLMIGDAVADIDMAKAAGAAGCVGVTWGGACSRSLSQADVVIKQPSDIQLIC
jgi:phosphoglycolate phosphatase